MSEGTQGLFDGTTAVLSFPNICTNEDRLSAIVQDPFGDRLSSFFIPSSNGDLRALFGK